MANQFDIFTAIIVIIVGLYDISITINRRHQPQKKAVKAYAVLGVIFTIFGIYLLVSSLISRG